MRSTFFRGFLAISLLCLISNIAAAEGATRNFCAMGNEWAVSTGHPEATRAAQKILEQGGNAVDAAVAAAFMVGVVDFTNSGPGGDAFALVHLANGRILAFDASIRKPASLAKNTSHIGLPCTPELLLKLLKSLGNLSSEEVMAPAIAACIKGFEVSPYLHQVITKKLPQLKDPVAVKFLAPAGKPIAAGSVLRQPLLGETLQKLAADHGESFYRGADAAKMVAHMNSLGSTYSFNDLKNYHSRLCLPLKLEWQNFSLYGNPPPSSSIVAIKLAGLLADSRENLFSLSPASLLKVAKISRAIIDFKYNYLSNYLIEPERFFKDAEVDLRQKPGNSEITDDSMTTHLCVWDKNNLAVSMTLTLGSHCGTGELSPLGFFYNNEMRNYTSLVASYSSAYPVNAGPISSKAPVMVKKTDKLIAILGGAGSDRIIANVGLMAARIMNNPAAVADTINQPRFFLDYRRILHLEGGFTRPMIESTAQIYTDTRLRQGRADYFGLLAAIFRNKEGFFTAIADFRRDGDCMAK